MKHNILHFLSLLRPVLPAFLSSRLLILMVCVFTSQLKTPTISAREGINYNTSIELKTELVAKKLELILLSADASWYQEIAEEGYAREPFTKDTPKNWVFFPLLPLLLKFFSFLPGGTFTAGLMLSNLFFLVSLAVLHKLALQRGLSSQEAERMLWFLAFFPTSYFFTAPLTESLFLLLSLLAFAAQAKGRHVQAAFWMLLCCTSRPTGLLIYPAYVYETLCGKTLLAKKSLYLLAPLLGPLAFMTYLHSISGNALSWIHNQPAWGRPGSAADFLPQLFLLPHTPMLPWNFLLLNFLTAVLAIVAAFHLLRAKKISWALFLAVPVFVSLSTGTLQSISRFTMTLFPLYFALIDWTHNKQTERILLVLFALVLGLMTALWALHGTAAMA
jgi:hypothetical protein